MEAMIFTFGWLLVCALTFLAWTYTKRGKKWLKEL